MCSMFWYRDLTSYTAKRTLIWFPPQHKNYIRLEPLQTLMIPWNIHIYCKICFHLQQNNFMLSQFYWKKEKNKKDCKCSHMKSCYLGRNRMETSRDVAGSVDVCIISELNLFSYSLLFTLLRISRLVLRVWAKLSKCNSTFCILFFADHLL